MLSLFCTVPVCSCCPSTVTVYDAFGKVLNPLLRFSTVKFAVFGACGVVVRASISSLFGVGVMLPCSCVSSIVYVKVLLVLLGVIVSSLFVRVTLKASVWFSGTVNSTVCPVSCCGVVVLAVCVRSVTGSPHVSVTSVFIVSVCPGDANRW